MGIDLDEWLKLVIEDPLDPDLPICDPHHHVVGDNNNPSIEYC